MSVKYKLHKEMRENAKHYGEYYARSVMTDVTNLAKIADRIQQNCSMKRSDVWAVLTEMVEVLKDELQSSHRVLIDGLGSFRIGLKTVPAKKPSDFSVQKNIVGARVNFLPSVIVDSASKKRVKALLVGLHCQEYGAYDKPEDTPPTP